MTRVIVLLDEDRNVSIYVDRPDAVAVRLVDVALLPGSSINTERVIPFDIDEGDDITHGHVFDVPDHLDPGFVNRVFDLEPSQCP